MSVTLKEIARHTGLSVPTVGNVLGRAADRYSASTRERVRKAAEELGYRPNSSARAMRQGRTGCAALILSRSHQAVLSHVPMGLLDGIDDELGSHNLHLAVTRMSDEQLSREDFVPKVLREFMADGMIVNYTHDIPPRMLQLIQDHHTPAVFVNAKLDSDCVYPDEVGGAVAAVEALIAAGHREIAFVHFIEPGVFGESNFSEVHEHLHFSVAEREAGYRRAMRDAGLTPRLLGNDRYVPEGEAIATVRAALSKRDRPTAMLLYSENDVSAVLLAATSLGLVVPRDLAVMQFYPVSETVAGIAVPAVPIPTSALGRAAVRMLVNKLADPRGCCKPVVVPYGPIDTKQIAPPGGA